MVAQMFTAEIGLAEVLPFDTSTRSLGVATLISTRSYSRSVFSISRVGRAYFRTS
jgi:hypothetical protein